MLDWLKRKPQGATSRRERRSRREVAVLREQLEAAQSQLRIRALEIEGLTDVIARDRARVRAEIAAAARATAESEKHD
jgi:hypothetical protein